MIGFYRGCLQPAGNQVQPIVADMLDADLVGRATMEGGEVAMA
jgi:hypothetical protein